MRHRGEVKETITETHQYIYAGRKLLRETISDGTTTKTLDFNYDNVGMPYSLIYNNGTTTTTYYYITNLQGDVMYLVDASGTQVASYDYDPYGKVINATGAMAEINPLRYRGYYYDTETGFYYLQSRYYDPEICRFINADSYASTGQGILGHNAFIYCSNSPVIYIDATGEDWVNTLVQYGFDVAEKVLQKVQYQVGKLDLCISFGVTGSVSPGIISFSQSAIIAIDTQGNVELQYQSNSVSVTTSGSFGASVTTSMSVIRSTSLDNLSEIGYAFGSSAFSPFYGLGGGFDYSISEGYHNGFPPNYYGYSTSAGIGVPSAPDIHGNVSKSKTVPGTRYNLFDVAYRMIHRARRKCEKWLEK